MRAGGAAGVLRLVVANGGSPGRLLDAVGLTPADLTDADHLLEVDRIVALFEHAAVEITDDAFGLHVGNTFDLGALGTLSYAVLNAPTVGAALRNLVRYAHAHMEGPTITLEVAGSRAQLSYVLRHGTSDGRRHNVEAAAAIGMQIMRRLAGPDWRARRVVFQHRRPTHTTEHERIFGLVPSFQQPANGIVFDVATLDAPVPGADRRLLPIIERHLEETFGPGPGSAPWLRSVRNAIARAVCDGHPTIQVLARQLGLSVRTLQRRLSDCDLVFRELVAEVRQGLARRYLEEGTTALTELAFLLGYSELSSFDRAFRRWMGHPPGEYLRRHRAG